jgi:hypothetical protein
MAPSEVEIETTFMTDFSVVEETPHLVLYKFWIKQGDTWHPIGPEDTSDAKSDHWIFTPPMPPGSVFAYWLGIYGHANTPYRVRIRVAQRDPSDPDGGWIERDSWTEDGVLNDAGKGGGVANTDVIRVDLV